MQDDPKLKSLKIVFILLLLAIGLVSWFDYKQSHTVSTVALHQIGLKIGKWEGTDTLRSDKERQQAAQGDLIVRDYRKGDNFLYLVAIQERRDRHRVHSPVDCYTGSGWTVLKKENIRLGGDEERTVRRIQVVKGPTSRLAYYWFSNGKERSASFRGHLLLYLRDILLSRTANSWVYFKVSGNIVDSPGATDDIIREFILELDQQNLFMSPDQSSS